MLEDDKRLSRNLSKEEKKILISLLNLIIPSSKEGKMPSAAEVGFLAYTQDEKLIPWIHDGLRNLIEGARREYGQDFFALSISAQLQLIDSLRRKFLPFFNRLTIHVIQCYYQHDHVVTAIGLPARPPFPEGYNLIEGDFTLLEPVYERGKIYRDEGKSRAFKK